MNVCDVGGPIVTFRESWPSRDEHQSEAGKAADREWLDYCRSREASERSAARKASSAAARNVHRAMAQAYAQIIRNAGT
jgi:hypothetical protein